MCGICGKFDDRSLCKRCENLLQEYAKFEVEEKQDFSKFFNRHLYIFKYEGIIRKTILNYKFNEKSYLYKTFVEFLLKNKKFYEILKSYDTIVPVPISKDRYKQRGYNQSFLIGKQIVRKINYIEKSSKVILCNNSIYKSKNVVEQSKLTKEERIANIQGVYELRNKDLLKNRKVLLIDDVYTTGSTVNECCKILNQANPDKIDVLTIAKD